MPETQYGFKKVGGNFDVSLPSGGRVQVRRIGVEDLMGMGLLEKLDQLGVKVQTQHIDRVKKPADRKKKQPTKAELAQQDDQIIRNMMDPSAFSPLREMIDRVCSRAIVQPKVEDGYEPVQDENGKTGWAEIPEHRRDPDLNYPQDMDFIDKMQVFHAVLPNQEDMARFRGGSVSIVGDVGSIAEDSGEA